MRSLCGIEITIFLINMDWLVKLVSLVNGINYSVTIYSRTLSSVYFITPLDCLFKKIVAQTNSKQNSF